MKNPSLACCTQAFGDILALQSCTSQFTPIWGNEQFTPGKKDAGFRSWHIKDIGKIMDLYVDGVLLSFDQICQRNQVARKHFFKYWQLRIYMSSKYKEKTCLRPSSSLEEITLGEKGHVPKDYNMLVTHVQNRR